MNGRKITAGTAALVIILSLALAPLAGCQSLTGNKQLTPAPSEPGAVGSSPGAGGGATPDTLEQRSGGGGAGGTPAPAGKQAEPGSSGGAQKNTQQMVVRDKTLTMEVASVRKAQTKINALAAAYGASVTNSNISSGQSGGPVPLTEEQSSGSRPVDETGPLSGTITIKVPVGKFDVFTAAVRKLGKVQAEAESTEDVAQQHIDMRARLKNLRAEEAAFVRFFRAATNVREMLSIEQQLARVRGEIESLQAQIDYLEKRAALATLTVNMSEPGSIVSPAGETWGFVDAIKQAIRNFVGVINFLIMMTGALLPLIIIGAAAFWIVRGLLRRYVFTKAKAEE